MLVQDKEVKIGHTKVQHGKNSDRIYVVDYKYALDPYLINQIQLLAKEFNYGKIIAKIPKAAKPKFSRNNFEMEATIPKFYNGKKPCLFMAKYNNEVREEVNNKEEIEAVLEKMEHSETKELSELGDGYAIRMLTGKDTKDMVSIYKEIFRSYPVPIYDEKYVTKTMKKETLYYGVFKGHQLVGISSCKINSLQDNVEMTDFAIKSKYRGKQLARHLLKEMEIAIKAMGIKTAYTIARSTSFPMNATFSNEGYEYSGTLWNNTQISGSIESMNVWYKSISH